ncbi:MAG: nitroreductase family protein [Bacteroidetes bacterium]|nr:nitroreductase family protein [Bacteroidota bacterium]
MEIREVIEKRRTVRDFKHEEISTEILKYSIENAFKAPSYNHLREWDFIIVKSLETKLKLVESENLNKEIRMDELAKLFENEELIKKEMYLDAIPKQNKMILNAPVVVIVVFKPKKTINKVDRIYDLNCVASAWCCIENFLLSLAEHDIYGVTYIPQHTGKVKKMLDIPEELEIAAIIPIGYKAENAKILTQKEINISERIHYERWK